MGDGNPGLAWWGGGTGETGRTAVPL